MGGRPWRERAPSFGEGALSLQTSLSHRELPPSAPAFTWQRFDSFCFERVLSGEVFVFWKVFFCKVRLSRLFCGWEAIRRYALHECRAPIAHKSGAKPRHVKNLHLPPEPKTSPESTRPKQSETNLRSAWAGALGGSSGKVREVWRVGNPLRKRVSCASKVFWSFFLTPRKLQPTSGTRRGRNGGQDQDRVTLREPSHKSPICRRGDTCCCGEASSAPERRT